MLLRRAVLILGLVLASLIALPLVAQTQPASKVYRIGFLGAESAAYDRSRVELVRTRLHELGYPPANILIETRFADGNYDRLPRLATEVANLKVDVLIASGTKAGLAAKRATTTIPIVVSNMGDAVSGGFIADYAHPGGNVTGMSLLSPETTVKQLELLLLIKPQVRTVAVVVNPANPNLGQILQELKREANALQINIEVLETRAADDIGSAFVKMLAQRVDALLVPSETLFNAHARAIADRAMKEGIASVGTFDYAHAGGLIGYSTNRMEAWRYLVGYVDKILKGAKPADLPVEQPTKNELVLNVRTAKVLGLTIPQSLLLRADEVIQ